MFIQQYYCTGRSIEMRRFASKKCRGSIEITLGLVGAATVVERFSKVRIEADRFAMVGDGATKAACGEQRENHRFQNSFRQIHTEEWFFPGRMKEWPLRPFT